MWGPAARELERRGRHAVVPSLVGSGGAPPADWHGCVEAVRDATRELPEPLVLVGHSGGGLLLPVIADAVSQPVRGLIFVDSGLPARAGETTFVPSAFGERFRSRAVEGILPPWSSWFGDEAMHELLPDAVLRNALVREMPRLPVAFLDQRIPSPAGWDQTPSAYLLLSEAYNEAAAEARARGWPVEEITGAQHLHIAVAPEAVADVLLRLELVL
jgi:pimeloyl-ACP methyl ester carboxylesterase